MSIRNDISIDWTASPRIIEVAAPSDVLTIQDLYDTLRYKGSQPEAMDDVEIIDGSGKEQLAPGTLVGLTVKLFNARVKFEDRMEPAICTVRGGNLVALDGNGQMMPPIEPSAHTTVVIAQSTSASLISGGASAEEIATAVHEELTTEFGRATEVHKRLGLDHETPVEHIATEIKAGDIVLLISEDAGKVTVQRQ